MAYNCYDAQMILLIPRVLHDFFASILEMC